ncbi:unnamed protein product [Kuraishia capsulata CBS 1993]|uniref:Vacuolar ATPase assembly integral membrane protein VPH2 n=1 Tax=Kuraishia capsulata CBS 1993 TaxID=1382522 RepID=W6MT09_9ASCO|nr:uncharacterized protein KUCA_T00005481001 [Kuraishia capsulata CBS 1993]CDK29493.1 unnamed protein product [Kuraishia capsulata CBS 1993]
MTLYEFSQGIQNLVDQIDLPVEKKQRLYDARSITHNDLITIYRLYTSCKICNESDSTEKLSLSALLKTTKICEKPIAPKAKKSPEFLRQMERLRQRQQELEYQELVKNSTLSFSLNPGSSPSAVTKELKHQVTTIINILISVVSVGYAVWYWTGTSMNINDAYRILLCLFFSILVLIAEVVVFGGYLRKIEEARSVERKKIEVKKVIESVSFESARGQDTKLE